MASEDEHGKRKNVKVMPTCFSRGTRATYPHSVSAIYAECCLRRHRTSCSVNAPRFHCFTVSFIMAGLHNILKGIAFGRRKGSILFRNESRCTVFGFKGNTFRITRAGMQCLFKAGKRNTYSVASNIIIVSHVPLIALNLIRNHDCVNICSYNCNVLIALANINNTELYV